MTEIAQPIEKIKKAYRVLGVPEAASALAIKTSYRKLIKRWHPDKPATSAASSEEAMMMTQLLNEAYALIENAPLRYYLGAEPASRREEKRATEKKAVKAKIDDINEVDLSKMFFSEKRIEYAVRIVFGGISGMFVGMAFTLDIFHDGAWIVGGILLGAAVFAVGAVKYGDRFWRAVFGNWWMWE